MSVNDPDYTVSIFAILVGIDTYSPPFSPLNKAVGDVNKVKRLLLDHRQIELKDITVLTNEKATRENIIEALSSLPRGLPRDTSVLFYFSGYSGSANESGVLCPVDSFEPGVGTISDKTLIRLFESMSLSLNGNITVFLDCFSEGFRWENPSSFVVISPEKATETVDGGAFTKSLVDVLKREKHLDGLTNESLVDKIRAAMGATIYCHGQQANHVIFNPRLELCHLFIRGRTEPGKIVIDAGYAQGIRTGSIFGVYTSSIQRDWNIVLGHLVVEVIHDTYTIVRFQGNRPFELPSVFFVVELDSELDTINAYILDGAENEHKSIQSIPGLKIVDSVKDAEIALKFGLENEQDVFCCTWNGIKGDKEYQRITTTRPILSAPNSVYSPIWLPLEDLRDHVRNLARFKYHMGRKIPNTGFSTVNLDWKLYEYGEAFDNLQDNFIHIQLKEGERRGPFYITLRNPNRFQVWPHVFIGVGDHHVINDWYESKLDAPLNPQETIMIPQDENDGLYFTWDPVRPAYLLYIKIFATKEYSSFSSMKQRSWLGDEVNLREFGNTKYEAPEVVIPDRATMRRNVSQASTASLLAMKFHWSEARINIKVDFNSQDEVHHDRGYH